MDVNEPLRVYSCWQEESSIKESGISLGKAGMVRYSWGDGEAIIYEEKTPEFADEEDEEMDDEFDTHSDDNEQ